MNATKWTALKKSAGYKVDETLPQHFEIVSAVEAGGTVSPVVWSEENARLMAAAPELLAAISTLVGIAETDCMDDKSNVWRSAMIAADAAIAKAEGRA